MVELGKALLGLGVLLVVVGGALLLAARFGVPLGRLPGDISYRGKERLGVLSAGHFDLAERRAFGDLLSDLAIPAISCALQRD